MWAPDMIIVHGVSAAVIRATVSELVDRGDFQKALMRLGDDA